MKIPSIFTKTITRHPKHLPLPQPLNKDQETVLSILHSYHRLLTESIWTDSIIKSTDTRPNSTVFVVNAPGHSEDFRAVFTNLDDGLSLLQEDVFMPTLRSIIVRWRIVKGAGGWGPWCLEESAEFSCFRLIGWGAKFGDEYLLKTKMVLMLLERVAGGDGGEGRRATRVHRWGYVDARKPNE